jgi:hypothetical protein
MLSTLFSRIIPSYWASQQDAQLFCQVTREGVGSGWAEVIVGFGIAIMNLDAPAPFGPPRARNIGSSRPKPDDDRSSHCAGVGAGTLIVHF